MVANDRCHPMERKSTVEVAEGLVTPEFKAAKTGEIEGYGAIFGNVDRGNDVVQAGAFADSLKSGRGVKMLWQHDPAKPIGIWHSVEEDARGLKVKGELLLEVQLAREALALVEAGAIDGLSMGYRTVSARKTYLDEKHVRLIEKADIWEVSLVTFPMNPVARLDAKKAGEMSEREFFRELLSGSKPSRKVAEALMRHGYKGVQALSDSGDEDYSELLEAIQAASLKKSLMKGNRDAQS